MFLRGVRREVFRGLVGAAEADPSETRADVAQLVEHSLGKGEVTSSILVIGSRSLRVEPAEILSEVEEPRSGGRQWECGSNSVVESQPSKLLVAGSIPVSRSSNSGQEFWKRAGRLIRALTPSAGTARDRRGPTCIRQKGCVAQDARN
jgi:hypothetical protein